eukprot:TRINITY_DN11186_c0_g1_i1.p1 TRINITY_DN11186_c0_g1~~TRINITY_DN11186_c0_g1_i1.p1  ORF type:complete len:282 (-),score=40.95 TRINITY_DN11186_c0_g1_i1:84-929(-)
MNAAGRAKEIAQEVVKHKKRARQHGEEQYRHQVEYELLARIIEKPAVDNSSTAVPWYAKRRDTRRESAVAAQSAAAEQAARTVMANYERIKAQLEKEELDVSRTKQKKSFSHNKEKKKSKKSKKQKKRKKRRRSSSSSSSSSSTSSSYTDDPAAELDQLDRALTLLTEMRATGHELDGPARGPPPLDPATNSTQCTVFVGGIPRDIYEADIRRFFTKVKGQIVAVRQHDNFAFVTWNSAAAANAACAMGGLQLLGSFVTVNLARDREREPRPPPLRSYHAD